MRNNRTKFIFLVVIFVLTTNSLKAQYKWTVGAYFIPAYVQYSFGKQKVNINLISGVAFSRQIKNRIVFNSGLFYFRNQLYDDKEACKICESSPFGAIGSYKGNFIEIPLGVKYKFNKKVFKFIPHVMAGVVSAFHLSVKETNIDGLGKVYNYHHGFAPDAWHGYLGVSLVYEINYRTILLIDPILRFPMAVQAYGYPIYMYEKLLGLGIGIHIRL